MRFAARDGEDGFTLIELMVVVLIIGVLIAIGLPTFLGARTRAQDRAVQSDLRNAFAAERTYYTDDALYTEDPAELSLVEPSINYVTGDTPAVSGQVYLHWHVVQNELFVSGRSQSGTCFYIREIDGAGSEFASSPGCAVADGQTFSTQGW